MISDMFFDRMKNILGDEYSKFEESLAMPPVKAVRANLTKVSRDDFLRNTSLNLTLQLKPS